MSNQFDELRRVSIKTNESFIGALDAQEKKQIKGLTDLEKKLKKAEQKNHETELNNITFNYFINNDYNDNIISDLKNII